MTDEQIIKALECCLNDSCYTSECFFFKETKDGEHCQTVAIKYALDLINRQKAEISVLRKLLDKAETEMNNQSENFKKLVAEHRNLQKLLEENNAEIKRRKNNLFCKVVIDEEKMRNIINEKAAEFELDIESIKVEAIKEFAERLKDNFLYKNACYSFEGIKYRIDNLVKEMVGDTE